MRPEGEGHLRARGARLASGAGISLAAAAVAPSLAGASDFTVTTLGDPAPGTCDLGDCSLREAVAAAEVDPNDDRIFFQADLSGTITLGGGQGDLDVSEPLEVLGPGAGTLSVSADAGSRIFSIVTGAGDDVTISGLTLTGGNPAVSGGALYGGFADLTIRDSTIASNDAGFGGGVASANGALTIDRSTLSGNGSTNGGGAVNTFQSTAMIVDSTITGNEAGFGGGIYATDTALTIESSTIADNKGGAGGGGVWLQLTYTDPVLTNTIVAGNTGITGPDLFRTNAGGFDASFSLIGSTADVTVDETVPGSNVVGQGAQLGPLSDNGGPTHTRALLPGSPALDQGSATGSDQRGAPRPFDFAGLADSSAAGANGADIGAFELLSPARCAGQPVTLPPHGGTVQGTAGRDVIVAGSGADVIRGGGGNDLICAGSGRDRLIGGPGKDVLRGEGGPDRIKGGPGRDRLLGGNGRDILRGGPGRDLLLGGPGRDRQRQ